MPRLRHLRHLSPKSFAYCNYLPLSYYARSKDTENGVDDSQSLPFQVSKVVMAGEPPASPSKPHKSTPTTKVVPLDSPTRQVAIHPDLPEIKVPSSDMKPYQYHPVSCEIFSGDELQQHKISLLQKQYTTSDAALKAQAEAVKEVKDRMAEAEKKTREINRQMEDMEKTREIERRIYMKQGKNLPDAI